MDDLLSLLNWWWSIRPAQEEEEEEQAEGVEEEGEEENGEDEEEVKEVEEVEEVEEVTEGEGRRRRLGRGERSERGGRRGGGRGRKWLGRWSIRFWWFMMIDEWKTGNVRMIICRRSERCLLIPWLQCADQHFSFAQKMRSNLIYKMINSFDFCFYNSFGNRYNSLCINSLQVNSFP